MKDFTEFKEQNSVYLTRCVLVREEEKTYNIGAFNNPESVVTFIQAVIGNEPQECMVVLCLNTKGYLSSYQVVSRGDSNRSLVDMSAIIRPMILSNSTAMIIAHNHPSGDPTPSMEDNKITKHIDKACKMMNLRLIDHIIVGSNRYYSYKESGHI